ncbi:MAG: hypothetical protein ABI970_26755, partial [Chloroflexota bacterium]
IIIVNHGQITAEGSPSELRANLERGGRVLLRLNVPPSEALPTIQGLPEVASAAISGTNDGIIAEPVNPRTDPRPAIARAVIAKGWDLIELRPLAVNLEEIFLEVTRRQDEEQEHIAAPEVESENESEVVS